MKTLQTRTTVDNPDIFNYSSFGLFHPLREAWLPRSDTWRPGIKLGPHGCTPLFHGCPQRCQNYPKIGLLHSNLAMFLPTSSKRKPLGLQVFDPQPDDPDECGSGYWKDVGVFEPHDVEAAVQLWAVWSHGIPHFLIGKWRTTPIHTIGMYPIYHCVFSPSQSGRTNPASQVAAIRAPAAEAIEAPAICSSCDTSPHVHKVYNSSTDIFWESFPANHVHLPKCTRYQAQINSYTF